MHPLRRDERCSGRGGVRGTGRVAQARGSGARVPAGPGRIDDALARVHAPARLDLGHLATDEIAVAIMAEIVQLRAAGALEPGPIAETPVRLAQQTFGECCVDSDILA